MAVAGGLSKNGRHRSALHALSIISAFPAYTSTSCCVVDTGFSMVVALACASHWLAEVVVPGTERDHEEQTLR